MGDLESEEPHQMVVGHCQRCDTVVEPRLSVQWFVHVKPLADRALASVREGRTRIVPDRFEKVYAHWMENIHDWAVGRQLWWGHRIPAWYCPDGHITVSDAAEGPDGCAECGRPAAELTQETDIFDTWFSSALWPFSTLGWPDRTPDMARFYPTTLMETAYEILFFWVARMMMMGLFCTDAEPFEVVYLHGIVRDPYGQKMSKTRGNVVDPLELIGDIGADALRFALVSGNAPGVDQRLTDAKVTGGRNFTNKLWNAARFVLSSRPEPMANPTGEATLAERWIVSRLAQVTERATRQLDELDLADYVASVYDFAWSDYCDWFLEMAKVELRREDATEGDRARIWLRAAETLADTLKLLHPIMPFITEAIWEALRTANGQVATDELLVTARWPQVGERDASAEKEFDALAHLVRAIRNARLESGVPAGKRVPLELLGDGPQQAARVQGEARYVEALARVQPFTIHPPGSATPPTTGAIATSFGPAWLQSDEQSDAGVQQRSNEQERLRQSIARLEGLLANADFTSKAPEAVVERERSRLREFEDALRQLGG